MEILPKKQSLLFLIAVFMVLAGMTAALLFLRKGKIVQPTEYLKEISQIQTQSTSDETAAIENDLNETNLSDLDRELSDIDKELNQTY